MSKSSGNGGRHPYLYKRGRRWWAGVYVSGKAISDRSRLGYATAAAESDDRRPCKVCARATAAIGASP